MGRILIAYFSAGGVTAKKAAELADITKGDLFEIRPEQVYTSADLDWTNRKSRSSLEMADLSCRPAVAGKVEDMDVYDTVFVGFPIWWYREPSIIDTFLEEYDFKGKKIVPFCTSGGSGIDGAVERIRRLLGEEVCVDEGRRIGRFGLGSDLKRWLEGYVQ